MDLLSGLRNLTVDQQLGTPMDIDSEEIRDESDVSMRDYTMDEMDQDQTDDNVIKEQDESDQTFQSDAKALVKAIFQPESQGFKVATQSNLDVDAMKSNQNYVVHNHYYNNVFTYPQQGSMSSRIDNNMDDQEIHYEDQDIIYNDQPYSLLPPPSPSGLSITPDQTLMMLNLIKQTLNYSIGIFFIGLLFKNLKSDVLNEYNKLEHIKNLKIDQCKKEYFINKCDEYGQLPALKDLCLEWSLCFSDEFHPDDTTFYTELVFKVIGSLINGFLEKFGNLNKAFLVTLLLVWYFGNFICGYYKGNSTSSNIYTKDGQQLSVMKKNE